MFRPPDSAEVHGCSFSGLREHRWGKLIGERLDGWIDGARLTIAAANFLPSRFEVLIRNGPADSPHQPSGKQSAGGIDLTALRQTADDVEGLGDAFDALRFVESERTKWDEGLKIKLVSLGWQVQKDVGSNIATERPK